LWGLNGSASLTGKVLTLTVVNPHLTESHPAQIMLRGDATAASAETEVLGGGDVHEHNTFEQPNAVVTKKSAATVSGKVVQFTLPPSSVTRFTITLT
jgi:alpha-N-arabinofuranosidase